MTENSPRINPYESTEAGAKPEQIQSVGASPIPWRVAVGGAFWAVLSSYPITAIVTLVYRFPVPFVGYVSGPQGVATALAGLTVYGVALGGFVVIGVLGAIGGFLSAVLIKNDPRRCRMTMRLWSLFVTMLGVFTLAILDKIIGPW